MNELLTTMQNFVLKCTTLHELTIADDVQGKILYLKSLKDGQDEKAAPILHELHEMCNHEFTTIAGADDECRQLITTLHTLTIPY